MLDVGLITFLLTFLRPLTGHRHRWPCVPPGVPPGPMGRIDAGTVNRRRPRQASEASRNRRGTRALPLPRSRADACKNQEPTETSLHDAKPSGSERKQGEDGGRRIGEEDKGRVGPSTCRTQGTQKTEVVKAEATNDEYHRLEQVLTEHGPDGIALAQQTGSHVRRWLVAPRRWFQTHCAALPISSSGRSVVRRTTPPTASRANATRPKMAVWTRPLLTCDPPRMAGRARSGRANRPPTASNEAALSPAVVLAGSISGRGQHGELRGSTGRVAARQNVGDAIAGQPCGDDGEPALGSETQSLEPKSASKARHLH